MKKQLVVAVNLVMMLTSVACGEGMEQPSSPVSVEAPAALAKQESGLSTTSAYAIQTCGGQMVSARNGGGATTAALETNRNWIKPWEKFHLLDMGGGWYVLTTANGNSVTVLDGGGHGAANSDVIHTDSTNVGPWEMLNLIPLGENVYALKTVYGFYLSALLCGGIAGSTGIVSDHTSIGAWEQFRFIELE